MAAESLSARPTSCHCLCGYIHPEHMGICRTDEDVVLVEMMPNPHARAVPFCGPCREALRERTGGRQG